MNKFEKYRSVYESPIKYCTEVPGKKNTSFVIMDFMGKSLLCAWRNNKTCKV